MIEPWKVVDSRVLHADRWIKVRADRCVNASGQAIEPYYVLEYPGWVSVVPVTERGELILAREYRHGAGEVVTGLPCGVMEPDETDPEAAARRELEEETGYAGGRFLTLSNHLANPSNQPNRSWAVLALGVSPSGSQRLDDNEEIEVVVEDYVGFMGRFWRGDQPVQVAHAAALHQAAILLMKASGPAEAAGLRRALRDEWAQVIAEG